MVIIPLLTLFWGKKNLLAFAYFIYIKNERPKNERPRKNADSCMCTHRLKEKLKIKH